jgi:Ca2+/H+ antiporter
MQEIYGTITPLTIITLIMLLTQFVKQTYTPQLSGKHIQYVALAFSALFVVPYEVFTVYEPGGDWQSIGLFVLSAVVYMLFVWVGSIGMYEVGAKIGVLK